MVLPKRIQEILGDQPCTVDETGMSGSQVICYEKAVLKTGEKCEESDNASAMLHFLAGKLPVPRILAKETLGGMNYLLMTRVPGKMSCDAEYMRDPGGLVRMLAKALKMLWEVDITDCPRNQGLDQKLRQAEDRVRRGMVDLDNVEPETFGEGGFRDPEHLLQWLRQNRPEEDRVLTHGDFCLPNIFLVGDQVAGFIDLGRSGVGDRYQDIALCYRSLCQNFAGRYGPSYPGFEPMLLFAELGMEPDMEKIRYYILLDELF